MFTLKFSSIFFRPKAFQERNKYYDFLKVIISLLAILINPNDIARLCVIWPNVETIYENAFSSTYTKLFYVLYMHILCPLLYYECSIISCRDSEYVSLCQSTKKFVLYISSNRNQNNPLISERDVLKYLITILHYLSSLE